MSKEYMIRQLLRGLESELFVAVQRGKMEAAELNRVIKSERAKLNEQTYSEVEDLYYATV